MKLTFVTVAVLSALALTGCNDNTSASKVEQSTKQEVANSHSNEQSADRLYKQASQTLFKYRAPEATMYGLTADDVGKDFSQELADFSPENEAKLRKKLSDLQTEILNYELSNTSKIDIDNQQVVASITQYYAGHKDFSIGYIDVWMGLSPFIVNQINGPLN